MFRVYSLNGFRLPVVGNSVASVQHNPCVYDTSGGYVSWGGISTLTDAVSSGAGPVTAVE